MIARRVLVSGRVQGVYFREWAVRVANELDVAGWIRNLRDGRVEIYVVGTDGAAMKFIDRLHEGSPASQVDDVRAEPATVEPVRSFVRRQSI